MTARYHREEEGNVDGEKRKGKGAGLARLTETSGRTGEAGHDPFRATEVG
jgi:hypothetical protein